MIWKLKDLSQLHKATLAQAASARGRSRCAGQRRCHLVLSAFM